MRLNGESINEVDDHGEQIIGETLLILLNSRPDEIEFQMPRHRPSERWVPLVDTFISPPPCESLHQGDSYPLQPRSVVVMVLQGGGDPTVQAVHESHDAPQSPHIDPPQDDG